MQHLLGPGIIVNLPPPILKLLDESIKRVKKDGGLQGQVLARCDASRSQDIFGSLLKEDEAAANGANQNIKRVGEEKRRLIGSRQLYLSTRHSHPR